MSRHYAALFDTNAITPDNTKWHGRAFKAIEKDPSAILITTPAEAFACQMLSIPVVFCSYNTIDTSLLMYQVMPISATSYVPLSFPLPWTTGLAHLVAGFRSCLSDDERADLSQ